MSRLNRQSFLGSDSERLLAELRVAVVGLGGGGSHIVQQLAHVGVGSLVLIDPDFIDESNLNRLVGGTLADVLAKEPKVKIGQRQVLGVNPSAQVYPHYARWQDEAEVLRECDVIVGCVDSFLGRSELERCVRRFHLPYVDIGMDVHDDPGGYSITGQVALSMPGRACLHCMNVLRSDLLLREANQYGAAGSRPQVVWPNAILASTAVGLIVDLATGWNTRAREVALLEYDGNAHEVRNSAALTHLTQKHCEHFAAIDDLGDPWF